jgi:signal peptidase I
VVRGTESFRDRRPTTRSERRSAAKSKRRNALRTVIEIVALVVAAFIVAMLVQAFLFKPFTIHQVSMQPTLSDGDRILLNRLAYHFGDPSRGDVVAFDSPVDESEDLVKRVVAVAGDKVAVRSGVLYVNEVAQDEPYLNESPFSGDFKEILVHEDEVFVMGDNRNHSGDSRLFGPIDVGSIIGKAFAIYWPIGHSGGL